MIGGGRGDVDTAWQSGSIVSEAHPPTCIVWCIQLAVAHVVASSSRCSVQARCIVCGFSACSKAAGNCYAAAATFVAGPCVASASGCWGRCYYLLNVAIVSLVSFMRSTVPDNTGNCCCMCCRPIQRFWVLETVARIPYFAYISILHLYESLGFWRAGADLRRVHFAEEWNELHHLQVRSFVSIPQRSA